MADVEPKSTAKDLKKRMVKALFSYTPENIDELELKVDDVLEVIEETEEGWWKGALNGNVGMFPSNFVIQMDHFPEELNNKSMNELSPTKTANEVKHLTQQESLQGQDENSPIKVTKSDLNVNQKPATTGKTVVDGNCIVKIVNPDDKKDVRSTKRLSTSPQTESSAPELPPKPIREQAKVMFPYNAQNEDELSLKEGDVIVIISKEIEDKGWWKGELNGRVGVFPDNFVELIKVEEVNSSYPKQRKPERPDKPVTSISYKANLRVSSTEKQNADCSPKHDTKITKTPPAKPPPPDIKKKDEKPERPVPPFVSKKPQLPPPMKKPVRPSVTVQISSSNSTKSKSSETEQENSEIKPEVTVKSEVSTAKVKKIIDVISNREEKLVKNDVLGFDAIESTSDKLVHLTATRAKAPNRRPPSHIFLRENDKENGVTSNTRRLSEPLPADVDILLSKEVELYKASLTVASDTSKTSSTSITSQSVTKSVTSDSSHNEIDTTIKMTTDVVAKKVETVSKKTETVAKRIETGAKKIETGTKKVETSTKKIETGTKKIETGTKQIETGMNQIVTDTKKIETGIKKTEIISKKSEIVSKKAETKRAVKDEDSRKVKMTDHIVILPKTDFFTDTLIQSSHESTDIHTLKNELNQLKTSVDIIKDTMVNRFEFTELQHQVNVMTDTIERYKDNLNQLKQELDVEKKRRINAESELERIKHNISASL